MNSKERTRVALTRSGIPDRIPVQFDLCKSLIEYFAQELGVRPEYTQSYYEDLTCRISANAIRTRVGSDVVVVGGTVAAGFRAPELEDGTSLNEFGMKMRPTQLYVEVVEPPLKNVSCVEDIERYGFPDPYAAGRFDIAKKEIARFGKKFFVIGDCELSLFELAWQLVGLERYMTALAMEEPWLEALSDKVEYWTTHIALQLVRLGVDALWFGEDLGTQTSVLMSPAMWRARFKPRYVRMFRTLKQVNPEVILIMHSDGAVASLLPDFIEMGVQVYNPVQPNVPGSGPLELKRRYGDSIAFFGGIDQQHLLPGGDATRISLEVRRLCKILGQDGGYLLAPAHIIQADVKPDIVRLMIDAAKGYGQY